MAGAVFLSAGVPDPMRGPEYAATADTVAINAAIAGLVHVVLGRRLLVFGGHPAITPMIWVVAEAMGVEYGAWVRLYQTLFFKDEFPEDNKRFQNTVFTPAQGDREGSLLDMRRRMIGDFPFEAGVFIGGMKGVEEEFDLFAEQHPNAVKLALGSTGAAALVVQQKAAPADAELLNDFDYITLLHRRLNVPVWERRYATPDLQPSDAMARRWQPGRTGGADN